MKILKSNKSFPILNILFVICLSILSVKAGDASDRFKNWQTMGPSGGDVRAIVIDPSNKDHLYISTLDGQIYTSKDAGNSWELLVNLDRPQLILDQLMIDSRNPEVIYASGHRHKQPGGFFKSSDGGKNWKEAKQLSSESIHSMTQSEKDPNTLMAGTTTGLWVSKDSGDTWQKVQYSNGGPVNIDSLAIDPRNVNVIYAGTWYRPFKSNDGGKTWSLINKGMIDDSDVFAITIDSHDPDHIISSACSGIYESNNAGATWRKLNGIPSDSRRTRDILQHPTQRGTIYAATTQGFWMTANSGKSWAMTSSRDLEINSIAVHPDAPSRIFIGTNNYGVMVSNDGGKNFVPTNGNFSSRFTYSVVADIERPNRLYATTINTATGGGFIFISDDSGKTWKSAVKNFDTNRTTAYSLVQDRQDPNKIYLGTNYGIFSSMDRGLSWTQITPPKPVITTTKRSRRGRAAAKPTPTPEATAPGLIPALSDKINYLIHTEDNKNGYLAGTNDGLYRSYDIAKGWEKLSFGEGVNHSVLTIFTSPQNLGQIWVGTAISGVIVSNDSGNNWAKVKDIPLGVPVSAIAVNPGKPDYVYVGTTQTFYVSKDGGKKFTRRGGNLPLGNFNSILINPNNWKEVYVGSALEVSQGIFFSDDGGWDWDRIDTKDKKLASNRIWSMMFDPTNPNRLLIGTHSSGIYRLDKTGKSENAENDEPESKELLGRPRISATTNQ